MCARLCRSHVILPKHVAKNSPKGRLLSESEWRGLGVQQSRGWVHYAIHRYDPLPSEAFRDCVRPRRSILTRSSAGDCLLTGLCASRMRSPEPHILLFRRPLGTDPTTGLVHGKRIDPATGKVVG